MNLDKNHDDKSKLLQLVINIKNSISQNIFGQKSLIEETLCSLLAGGHILMTGAPGLAKTTLIKIFAKHLNLKFSRIQFTPDLLPSDIIGTEILNIDPVSGKKIFDFSFGPIFASILLADEINRSSPRTQSALLEAMQEKTVTIAGKKYDLPDPFVVFATQNPFESEGTFPLPEAQLDRFLIHTIVDYPSEEMEKKIFKSHADNSLIEENSIKKSFANKLDQKQLSEIRSVVKEIKIEDFIIEAITILVRSTRPMESLCPKDLKDHIIYGAGPRAGISMISMAKAYAFINEDLEVRWHHIKKIAKPILRHRIKTTTSFSDDNLNVDDIISNLISNLEKKYKSVLNI